MLIYGDVEVERDAGDMLDDNVRQLRQLAGAPPGLQRHSDLVSVFIEAGTLIGGALDRSELAASGTAMEVLTQLARSVDASWTSSFAQAGDLMDIADRFTRLEVDGTVGSKPAEGYAFYALYPESYAEAARQSGLPPDTRVIGIRSIGTTLAPMVAAGLCAPAPLTVRPTGHPFDRRIEPSALLAEQMLSGDPPAFAVVDEGPGLSGSSFASVADWLVGQGVARNRIHFFPSHPNGPGHQASEQRQQHWRDAPKHFVSFDDIAASAMPRLIEDMVGAPILPLRDISGGAWRVDKSSTAPAAEGWEKRKFLVETRSGQWLVKFAGLGPGGAKKLGFAHRLHGAGMSPETVGQCHGFIVQRWVDAPTLFDSSRPADLMAQLAAYLAVRATFSAPPQAGASQQRLREMGVYNAQQSLGPAAGDALAGRLTAIAAHPRVYVDARMHRWEWLVDGHRLIKTDAIDHWQAHDFIGAQPIEWDIAGAIIEHDLDGRELAHAFERAARQPVAQGDLDFYLLCYVAFQLGAWTMSNGADTLIVQRYRAKLRDLLRM